MNSFNLGGFADSVRKGIDYDRKEAKLLAWAVTHGRADALHDLAAVAQTFAHEVEGIAGDLLIAVLSGDPFAGSRHLLQSAIAKYGAEAGL